MDKKKYVMGVDYGTDSCRVLIVDALTGEELASAVSHYPRWKQGLYCDPASNRYRQHPLDYIESLEEATRKALSMLPGEAGQAVYGISFDTTGSTPVLIDSEGTPLALLPQFAEEPDAMFMLWKDHTSTAEADEINALAREWPVDYTAYSGGVYSSEWVWAKTLHIIRHNKAVAAAAYSWTEHCDWMPALLTGNCRPENMIRSRCAAGHKAMWSDLWDGLPSEKFLGRLDPKLKEMRAHLFRDTHTTEKPAGRLTARWAARLGLREGTAVSVGAIDAHVGAVGACTGPYVLTRIIGTSTCDIMIIDPAELGDKCISGICGQVDGSVIPGYVGIEAGQSAFGDIYAWFRDVVSWPLRNLMPEGTDIDKAVDSVIPQLMEEAGKIEPDANGIVALDWMNGRRTPYADQSLTGAIAGLTLGSTAPMIFRALVEATAFGSKAIIDHLKNEGVEIKYINAIGGISHKSPLVMQILADVLGMPIRVVRSQQACALGAAMFAAVAAGIYPTVAKAQQAMGSGFIAEYYPGEANSQAYSTLYERYLELGNKIG